MYAPPKLTDPSSATPLDAQFRNPPNEFRMIPLFRVNDKIDEAELRWQIRSLKEQGCGGIFSICEVFGGGTPDKFLSEGWWKVVEWLTSACAEEGLQFWVYDDEDWPSGSVGGQLVTKHPEHGWKYLKHTEHHGAGSKEIEFEIGSDMFVGAMLWLRDGSNIIAESIANISESVSDGKLRYITPDGDWTITVYTAPVGKGFFLDNLADLMDKDACAEFIDEVYQSHYDRVAQVPGARIVGFFTDEPCLSMATMQWTDRFHWWPSMPFTPSLPDKFKKRHGYDWFSNIPHLYFDLGPESIRFRCHHWDTCCQLYAENYFGQIYDFCEERGLLSSGHLMREEEFENLLTLQGGNSLRHYRRMHVPGVDWIHPIESYPHLASITFKCATSMAHLMNRPRTWCESFAGAGWGLSFHEMREIVNWEHVNGINMQIPITYKYSLHGVERTTFYPPGLSYQQPYWDHLRAFADYEARLCAVASGSGHVAQIALLYPSTDLWGHCWELALLNERSREYNALSNAIRSQGYDYDIVDDEILQHETRIDSSVLQIGSEEFEVLLIPKMDVVARNTLEVALKFARAGGVVLFVGAIPRHSMESGSDDPELSLLLRELLGDDPALIGHAARWKTFREGAVGFSPTAEGALALLRRHLAPDVQAPAGVRDVCAFRRRTDYGDFYLLFNDHQTGREIQLSLATAGTPEYWNPKIGEVERLRDYEIRDGRTELVLKFAPYEMMPILIRTEGKPDYPLHEAPGHELQRIPIPGPFSFEVEETMKRPHVAWNFTDIEGLWTRRDIASATLSPPAHIPAGDWSENGLKYFSGIGHYVTEFTLPADVTDKLVILHLGKVGISASVKINGAHAGISCLEPHQLDITAFVHPGQNTLRVSVANTLANFFAQFVELDGKPLSAGGDYPRRCVSGLLGPVSISVHVRSGAAN